ncbi:hypothetical protein ICN46_07260 [Polynucleobacter sp. Latsch14-2]|jgi:hypothetical protein|nr:hypothetical protein [Polynucleobacter sp. Latsch14-2]
MEIMLPPPQGFSFTFLFIDIICGLIGLTIILIFHGSALNHIVMRFERLTKANLALKQYNRIFFHFYVTFIFFALIHISEIFIWSGIIIWLHLIPSTVQSILFAGSCYTTVGFVSDILPTGWKSLSFFIAFTGLFSLAWTTSVMIGMTSLYKEAWNLKYDRRKL